MKKGLLLLLAVFSMGMARAQVDVTDVSSMDYAIYAPEMYATVGQETLQLPINLKCAEYVTAFQFKLYLPDGVTTGTISKNAKRVDALDAETFSIFNTEKEGYVEYMGFVASKNGIHAGDDLLLYVTLNLDASMEPGDYEIKVVDGTVDGLSGKEGTKTIVDVPCISKLIISGDLHYYDYTSNTFTNNLTTNIVVHRTINANEWSTICLPFAMTGDQVAEAFGEDVKFADFTGADYIDGENIHINFTSVDAVNEGTKANRPYIIRVSKAIDQFSVKNATIKRGGTSVSVGSYAFRGTLVPATIPEQGLYLSGDKFFYSMGKTPIKSFRGYFFLGDDVLDEFWDAYDVKINLVLDDATKIESIDNVTSNGEIYNLNGIKIGTDQKNLGKGIYIVNGKKIVK